MPEAAPTADNAATSARGPRGPLIGGAIGLLLGGASFGAIYTRVLDPVGLLPGGKAEQAAPAAHGDESGPNDRHGGETAAPGDFLPLDPITVSLAPDQKARHLRFSATIETAPGAVASVAAVKPRVVDVLNGFLRAVDVAELEDPTAMPRLQAQMLRRVRLVGGGDAVRDILITEFILN